MINVQSELHILTNGIHRIHGKYNLHNDKTTRFNNKCYSYVILIFSFPLRLIYLVGRVFTNCPGDMGSIPDHFIPNTLKMVLDTSLLNTQQYKVRIKGKVE